MRIHPAIFSPIMIICSCTGKATLFVANQDTLDAQPEQTIKALADETDSSLERNKTLATEIKAASAGAFRRNKALQNDY